MKQPYGRRRCGRRRCGRIGVVRITPATVTPTVIAAPTVAADTSPSATLGRVVSDSVAAAALAFAVTAAALAFDASATLAFFFFAALAFNASVTAAALAFDAARFRELPRRVETCRKSGRMRAFARSRAPAVGPVEFAVTDNLEGNTLKNKRARPAKKKTTECVCVCIHTCARMCACAIYRIATFPSALKVCLVAELPDATSVRPQMVEAHV